MNWTPGKTKHCRIEVKQAGKEERYALHTFDAHDKGHLKAHMAMVCRNILAGAHDDELRGTGMLNEADGHSTLVLEVTEEEIIRKRKTLEMVFVQAHATS